MNTKEVLKLLKRFSSQSPEDHARSNIRTLKSRMDAREGKYIRNLNRYNNNGVRREDLWTPYVYPQAYVLPAQNASGVQTQFNLIKSCVDTLTSKISQATVRPFFNPLNGDHETDRACKVLQQHFDFWLDEQHAYPKSTMCFRDAAIFDMGVLGIDPEHQSLDRVPPWEYFIDPAEHMNGSISHCMRYRKYYPASALIDKIENAELKKVLGMDIHVLGEYAEYYDLYRGQKWEFFDRYLIRDPVDLNYEQYGGLYRRPFLEIYYTKPVKGFFSVGLADALYPIQRQVDEVVRRFDNATRNMPLALGFVPKGSGLKATNIGNAVTLYDVLSGGENGQVQFVTPQPLSQEWIQLLNMYIDKAYELEGISKMSAQSKKPADVEAAKALETLEDIESDRFNTQLQQYTHFLVDAARLCIDVFPKDKTILPPKVMRDDMTWGDARKIRDKYSIQFSAASVLSKDPDKKMDQIMAMINGNFIDHAMASHFMQIPDLEGVYTVESAGYDAVQAVIEDIIEGKNNKAEYWETVDLNLLQSETVKRINMLMSVHDDERYIKRLIDLLQKVTKQLEEVNKYNAPQPTPPAQVKDEMLDGAQTEKLALIAEKLNAGTLGAEQASGIIMTAIPSLGQDRLNLILQKQAPPAPIGIQGASPPGGSPAPDQQNAGSTTKQGGI